MSNLLIFFINYNLFNQDMFGYYNPTLKIFNKKTWGDSAESIINKFSQDYNVTLYDGLEYLSDNVSEEATTESYSNVKINRDLFGYDTCSLTMSNINYERPAFIINQIMVFAKIDNSDNFTLEFSGRINPSDYRLRNNTYRTNATYTNYIHYALSQPINENLFSPFKQRRFEDNEYDFFGSFVNKLSLNTNQNTNRGGYVRYRIKDENIFLKEIKEEIKEDINNYLSKPKNGINTPLSYIRKVSNSLGVVFGFNKNEISITWYKDEEKPVENRIWTTFFLNSSESNELNKFDFDNITFKPVKFDFNKIRNNVANQNLLLEPVDEVAVGEGNVTTVNNDKLPLNPLVTVELQEQEGVKDIEETKEKQNIETSIQTIKKARKKEYLFQNHLTISKVRGATEPRLGDYVLLNISDDNKDTINNRDFFNNRDSENRLYLSKEKFDGAYMISKYSINFRTGNISYDITSGYEYYEDYDKKIQDAKNLRLQNAENNNNDSDDNNSEVNKINLNPTKQ